MTTQGSPGVQWMVFVKEQSILITCVAYYQKGQWRKSLRGWRWGHNKLSCSPSFNKYFSGFGKIKGSCNWGSSYLLLVGCCRDHSICKHFPGLTPLRLKLDVYPPAAFPTGSFHVIKKKCERLLPRRPPQEFNSYVGLQITACRKQIFTYLHIFKGREKSVYL